MFRASSDGGATFADKINLSNSTNAESQDVEIAADGENVIVTWWERFLPLINKTLDSENLVSGFRVAEIKKIEVESRVLDFKQELQNIIIQLPKIADI